MYIITLEEAKKHLNMEDSWTEDDTYIESLIEVSFYSIKNYCNNTSWIDNSGNTSGSTEFCDFNSGTTSIPLVIRQAILLMVGNLYANREPVSFSTGVVIPYTIGFLIAPYIDYDGVV